MESYFRANAVLRSSVITKYKACGNPVAPILTCSTFFYSNILSSISSFTTFSSFVMWGTAFPRWVDWTLYCRTGPGISYGCVFGICEQVSELYNRFNIVRNTCHPVPCYLNSDKLFLTLSNQYRNPERGFKPGSFSGYNQLRDCMSPKNAWPPRPV